MFKKKNCFYSEKEIDALSGNNQLHIVVNLLSSAIIRYEMRLMSKKERIINKNTEERTGLLGSAGQNWKEFINDYNRETV
jgi:hypothetical protein